MMAKTYKDMRLSTERSVRRVEGGRQNKMERRARSAVSLHFGFDKVRPTQLTKGERPWRLAKWRLAGDAA